MATILIVDDDAALRDALAEAIGDLGHEVRQAAGGGQALAIIAAEPIGAVLLDLRMPGLDGLTVLGRIRAGDRPPPVSVLTAHATAANTIEAMRLGAYDHLTKPIAAAELERVVSAMLASAGGPPARSAEASDDDDFIGSSAAMREVQKTIGRLADSDTTVLITGETGTGKELVARAIHRHGRRARKPFMAINCAAIPRDLLESELFGHVKGAFTGATLDRAGAFRDANGGTIFLDEIGDMDLGLQAKILRVLQERVVTPVGGRPAPIDIRVVAATHHDLDAEVRRGLFRQDLFYRLNVIPIHLPPLRDRIADIVPLAEHFLAAAGGPVLGPEAAAVLVRSAWPGNVRELRNAMSRAAVLVRGPRLRAADLAFLADPSDAARTSFDWPDEDLPTATARLETMLIRRAMDRAGGNRTEAARILNIRRQLLYVKLERYARALSSEGTEDVRSGDA